MKGKCKKIQKTLIVWIIKSIRLLTKVNLYRWNIFSIGVAGKYIFPASLVLETDAPYIRIPDVKGPNTSLSLWDIAERIAIVRGTTTEKIIELTTRNAERLFDTGYADV